MASSVNLDTSDVLNITCRKGDTFSITLTLKNSAGTALTLSTSGYVFLMQVKSTEVTRRGGLVRSSLILGTPNAAAKDQVRVKSKSRTRVPPPTIPSVPSNGRTFEAPTVDDGKHAGVIGVGGLILAKIPKETVDERRAYYQNVADQQIQAVDNDLMRESNQVMPISTPNRSSKVTFGKGGS